MAVYDPKKVNVVVAGATMTGFTEGSIVSCERNEDRATPYIGCKGEGAFALSGNNSGTVTISLQQGSPSNKHLKALANAGSQFPVSVIDTNADGGFRAGGTQAMILKEPPDERGSEISENEWEIYVLDYSNVS